MGASLEVSNVSKRWGSVVAVDSVSLSIDRPSLVALLGPNGAGKSTLLNIVAGVVPPDSGVVKVCSVDLWANPRRAKKFLGFAPQEGGFDPRATVAENALYVASLYGGIDRARVRAVLEAMGLWELRRRLVSKLSGGERKKLSIALALLHDPPVLLLDEPTSGLDPGARRDLMEMLRSMARRGKVVLVSTHIGSDAELCDRILLMHRGRIVMDSSPTEAKERVFGKAKIVEIAVEGDPHAVASALGGSVSDSTVRAKCENVSSCVSIARDAAERAGARIVEIRIREPTIDDLFVEVTGARLG